jgi:hypothetical protein
MVLTGAAATFQGIPRGLRSQSALPPPEVISGGIRPLLQSNLDRPLRYLPKDGEFDIRNGREFFNRPLYSNSAFRVDAGDLPEFSLYLPGHGGNLKLGFIASGSSKWAALADVVVARYVPGRMIYEIRDALLGDGSIAIELLTLGEGSGLIVKVEGSNMPQGGSLAWAFGGASGRKGRRGGDIGCEVEPVAQFFQVRKEECAANKFDVKGTAASLSSPAGEFAFQFPEGSTLRVAGFDDWLRAPSSSAAKGEAILTGEVEFRGGPLYLRIQQIRSGVDVAGKDVVAEFDAQSKSIDGIANTIAWTTPDDFLNAAAPALGVAAEAIWDPQQGCVMHGAVAWRSALVGWRGPYVLNALGHHDRMKENVRHWIAKQNVSPVTGGDPAKGPFDDGKRMSRKECMLHSNGDLSHNHYDMNLVFFDGLLRHLRWTGDMEFAREIWPAYKRHLAWERRLFRREYATKSGERLPLYEAYAAIWASDNLQYNGGGTAHASAYNLFSFHRAAELALLLGEDGSEYQAEARLIAEGMHKLLWVPERGLLAESKDLMEPQTVYDNPALWTVYHAIDSEAVSAREGWQMIMERLHTLRRVPVTGDGVPEGGYMLSCSDWLPYMWSLNLLLLSENVHLALAMFQVGISDEAYNLLKGNLVDSMYRGLCPGDFHMTSDLDAHRQEAQRDFGDPIGITSRAIVEGLFGVRPDLLRNVFTIRPSFPADWTHASLKHQDFDFSWRREGMVETYEFAGRFGKSVTVQLELPARTTTLPKVMPEAVRVGWPEFDCVGCPLVVVTWPTGYQGGVVLKWSGERPTKGLAHQTYAVGDSLRLPEGVSLGDIDDPQGCVSAAGRVISPGVHTLFANLPSGSSVVPRSEPPSESSMPKGNSERRNVARQTGETVCRWTMPITFTVKAKSEAAGPIPRARETDRLETVALPLSNQITEIFTRKYSQPRSPFCSLAIPDTLLGGWANIGEPIPIDDSGLRRANGALRTAIGVPFSTPAGHGPNCLFLSYFEPDKTSVTLPVSDSAHGLYLLVSGTTLPQCSRMVHATLVVTYTDNTTTTLALRNPETWWPIEQDYLLDDFLFCNEAPLPPRVDLATGKTRVLDPVAFKGHGRAVPGGAATILHLELDGSKTLSRITLRVDLYGIVVALLGVTLSR